MIGLILIVTAASIFSSVASTRGEIEEYSKKMRSFYQTNGGKSEFKPCKTNNKSKQCVIVINFDPAEIDQQHLSTHSSTDIAKNIPIQIKTKFDIKEKNLFYVDLKFIKEKMLQDPAMDTEKILKELKTELIETGSCEEINIFYTGHGSEPNGDWETFEPVLNKNTELPVSFTKKVICIDAIATDKSTIVSDSCFSGGLFSQASENPDSNFHLLVSSSPKEGAIGDKESGGVFSEFQTIFLSTKNQPDDLVCTVDLNGDGELSYNEYNLYLSLFRIYFQNDENSVLEMNKNFSFTNIQPSDFISLQEFSASQVNTCYLKMPKRCHRVKRSILETKCHLTEKKITHIKNQLSYLMSNLRNQYSRYLQEGSGLKKFKSIADKFNPKDVRPKVQSSSFDNLIVNYKKYLVELTSSCPPKDNQCNLVVVSHEINQLLEEIDNVMSFDPQVPSSKIPD